MAAACKIARLETGIKCTSKDKNIIAWQLGLRCARRYKGSRLATFNGFKGKDWHFESTQCKGRRRRGLAFTRLWRQKWFRSLSRCRSLPSHVWFHRCIKPDVMGTRKKLLRSWPFHVSKHTRQASQRAQPLQRCSKPALITSLLLPRRRNTIFFLESWPLLNQVGIGFETFCLEQKNLVFGCASSVQNKLFNFQWHAAKNSKKALTHLIVLEPKTPNAIPQSDNSFYKRQVGLRFGSKRQIIPAINLMWQHVTTMR